MRKIVLGLALVAITVCNSGCFVPIYSADKSRRMNQLLNTSENLRQVKLEWERIWLLDQPSHMTPFRTHGGIGY